MAILRKLRRDYILKSKKDKSFQTHKRGGNEKQHKVPSLIQQGSEDTNTR
jgi:hypothetical protein